jgi:hypothetical protein
MAVHGLTSRSLHGTKLIEIRACLASVERMIGRAQRLSVEYEQRIRKANYSGPPVESLEHVISFPEVRSLDLLCKDALERALPDHPQLTARWYVHDDVGFDSPEELHSDLLRKRTTLQHALDLAETAMAEIADPSQSSFGLPKGYGKLVDPVRLFFEDSNNECLNYDKNVFVMTRFQDGNCMLSELDATIRDGLRARGLVGHRADDRCYPNDRNLWDNVCTYMLCCKYGVAVLEDIIADEFNPNVALEYGFMRALGKPTLLLKERRFKPRADILGTVWNEFDVLDAMRRNHGLPLRLLPLRRLPALSWLAGHSPAQLARCAALGKAVMSDPISATRLQAATPSTPGTVIQRATSSASSWCCSPSCSSRASSAWISASRKRYWRSRLSSRNRW